MTVTDKIFRKEKIELYNIRFPLGILFEDNVFFMNFISVNRKAFFLKKRLYRYFRREDSTTGQAHKRKEKVGFNYIYLLEMIYDFWKKEKLFPKMMPVFENLCIARFRSASDICQPWERAGLVYTLAAQLHKWRIEPQNKVLRAIKEGDLCIRIGSFWGRDITFLKSLKGLQKIFYVGNCQGKRILCIFSIKILSWKKTA